MAMTVEKISAVTFRVRDMRASVQFYRDVLGMELLYGGEASGFSSLRPRDRQSAILNLEEGEWVTQWGRLIFHVSDVGAFWSYLCERDFVRTGLGTLHGENVTFTRPIQMGTSCHLRNHCRRLPARV